MGLLGAVLVVAACVFGDPSESQNLAPTLVLGVAFPLAALGSLVLGPWWPRVDPLRTVAGSLGWLREPAPRPLPGATPWLAWCAVTSVAWAVLVRPPTVLAFTAWLAASSAVHLAGAARCGAAWLDRVEPFTATSRLLGSLAPGHRTAASPDARHVAGALVGWGVFDLVTETAVWQRVVPAGSVLLPTLGLLACAAAAAGILRRVPVRSSRGHAAVAALGAGWVAAQHLAPLLVAVQGVAIWLSDPLARGWDLLGTAGWRVQFQPLPAGALLLLTVTAFLAGHLAAVLLGHRAALGAVGARQAGPAQLEWRGLLLASLCGGAAAVLLAW